MGVLVDAQSRVGSLPNAYSMVSTGLFRSTPHHDPREPGVA
jgi:hypothetical protein